MDSDEKPSKNKELGIFSSPDLTVDTEKLAGFGRNAATAKTQELQSTVKSTGDKKRNVIPLIIAATVILVVGGIVAGIALSKNVSQGSGSAAESGQKFDQFATYLLFMESSTNLSGEYEPGHSYQLSEHFYSETPDDNYWETSGLLLKNAVEAYSAMQNGQSQDMLSRLQDYQTRFKVLQTCHLEISVVVHAHQHRRRDFSAAAGMVSPGFSQAVAPHFLLDFHRKLCSMENAPRLYAADRFWNLTVIGENEIAAPVG